MFFRLVIISTLMLLAAGCTESMVELGGEPSLNLNDGDNAFFKQMSLFNMDGIDSSRLALLHSNDAKLKAFARRMIDSHAKAGQELSDLAMAKGVILPVELDSADQTQIDNLSTKTGSDFDRAFLAMQIDNQKRAVAADQDEADNGIDHDTKALASRLLDTLKSNLSMSEKLQNPQ